MRPIGLAKTKGAILCKSAPIASADGFTAAAQAADVDVNEIGKTGGDELTIDDTLTISIRAELARIESGLVSRFNVKAKPHRRVPMPMSAGQLEQMIRQALPDAQVEITDLRGDGDHYAAHVVSAAFAGKSRVRAA